MTIILIVINSIILQHYDYKKDYVMKMKITILCGTQNKEVSKSSVNLAIVDISADLLC